MPTLRVDICIICATLNTFPRSFLRNTQIGPQFVTFISQYMYYTELIQLKMFTANTKHVERYSNRIISGAVLQDNI